MLISIVFSIMLLVISTKGCHLHTYLGKENNNTILVQNFTREEESYFCSDTQKC